MLIQVNTDSKTHGTADLSESVQSVVEGKLSRFAGQITRAEVHLTDENGPGKTGGNDKRCMIEVRLAGMDPITATDFGATHALALRGAADKMLSQIESITGRLGRA
jgi:ribosome-associated translation inhibitor RaiA